MVMTAEATDRRAHRRRAILDAAREMFLENGYDAVSLSEIVRRSGGSLTTVYELFESKLGLLGAVMADQRFGGVERIDRIIASDLPPPQMVAALAELLDGELGNDAMIRLLRLVTEQMRSDPAFARSVFESSHLPILDRVCRLFDHWAKTGHADIPDADIAVLNFFGLMTHRGLARALFGGDCEERMPDKSAHLRDAIDLFVRGYAIR